jgi:predicted DNA-binding protein YlxM (UPF0122 family)
VSLRYTTAQAERAVYRAYLEELGEADEQSLEHLKNCIRESICTDLSEKQREYLTLYMSGYSSGDIAEEYRVHKATVSRSLNRALDRLFEHIRYATPRTLTASKRIRKYLTRLTSRRNTCKI